MNGVAFKVRVLFICSLTIASTAVWGSQIKGDYQIAIGFAVIAAIFGFAAFAAIFTDIKRQEDAAQIQREEAK